MAYTTFSSVVKLTISLAIITKVFMLIDNRGIFIDMRGGMIWFINPFIIMERAITPLLL